MWLDIACVGTSIAACFSDRREVWPSVGLLGNRRMHTYSNKLIVILILTSYIDCCCCQHNAYPRLALLRSNMLLMCAFVYFQRGPTLGVLQATHSTAPKAAVFHVSKSCNSIQTLQQSFTYPNLAAAYQVSKPCSSLSGIQTFPAAA